MPIQRPEVVAWVDSPALAFTDEVSHVIGVFGVINETVGDIDRILQYPTLGFQAPHDLPADMIGSWRAVSAEGFRSPFAD